MKSSSSSTYKYQAIRIVQFLGILVLVAYPFAVWFGLSHEKGYWVIALLCLVFILRLSLLRGKLKEWVGFGKVLAGFGFALCVASVLLKNFQLLLYYPVLMNVLLLILFGSSLLGTKSFVERLARLQERDLPPAAVRYTRHVTMLWCLFFIINGSIALATCLYGSMQLWALYNGLISYILIGLLMAAEWIVRKRVGKHS